MNPNANISDEARIRLPMAGKMGILVIGHGTKSGLGTAEFARVVSRLRDHFPDLPLSFGFLEHARPSIGEGVQVLVGKGVTSILAAPLLLFSAGHAKLDIPVAVQNAAEKHRVSVVGQAEVLGIHPRLIELTLRRYRDSCETLAGDSAFVLVGRGNRDLEAQVAALEFLEACREQGELPVARLGYLAMAKPLFVDVLEDLGRSKIKQCVILPHLLFHGELVTKCERAVASIAEQFPLTNWQLAKRLGPHEAVVLAAVDRIRAAQAAVYCRSG